MKLNYSHPLNRVWVIHSQFYFYICNETAGIRVYSWTPKKFAPHLLKLVSSSKILISTSDREQNRPQCSIPPTKDTDCFPVILAPGLLYFTLCTFLSPPAITEQPLITWHFYSMIIYKEAFFLFPMLSLNNVFFKCFRLYLTFMP